MIVGGYGWGLFFVYLCIEFDVFEVYLHGGVVDMCFDVDMIVIAKLIIILFHDPFLIFFWQLILLLN